MITKNSVYTRITKSLTDFIDIKAKRNSLKSKALTLKELKTLQPGDFVTHIDHGVGRFAGLDTVDVGSNKQEAMRLGVPR